MKISVVTVCFNAERTIAHTVESFLAQDHPHKELLVIDGASRDGTLRVLERFADPRITVRSERDRGLYDAMNKGLRLFSGDVVGFLNADDRYCDKAALSSIAEALARADMVSGDLDFVTDHAEGRVLRRWRGTPYAKGGFRRGWMPAHPTFYMRRRVAEAVGEFDLAYRIAADYDYMLRAYELQSFTSAHIGRVLVHMMAGGESTAGLKSYVRSNLESLRSRRRWLGAGFVDYALVAKPLRKLGQFAVRSSTG